MHGARCFLQELPGHVHFCTGGYREDSSLLCNFEGFKLVTNLKETKEAKCKIHIQTFRVEFFRSLLDHCRILRSSFIGIYALPLASLLC